MCVEYQRISVFHLSFLRSDYYNIMQSKFFQLFFHRCYATITNHVFYVYFHVKTFYLKMSKDIVQQN